MAKLFDGTNAITESVENKDLISDFLETKGFTYGECKIEFYAKEDILVSINDSTDILLETGTEIEEDQIWSFKLREDGKNYLFYAIYDTFDVKG